MWRKRLPYLYKGIILTKVVATDSGNTAAVIEKAETSADVDPKDSITLSTNDSVMNV